MNHLYRTSPDRVLSEVAAVSWWRGFMLGMLCSAFSLACWVGIFRGLSWVWGAI